MQNIIKIIDLWANPPVNSLDSVHCESKGVRRHSRCAKAFTIKQKGVQYGVTHKRVSLAFYAHFFQISILLRFLQQFLACDALPSCEAIGHTTTRLDMAILKDLGVPAH